MQNTTILYLVKQVNGKITELLLAKKKRGFAIGMWNGVGGKVENESVDQAAIREAKEEVAVEAEDIQKVAELQFYYTEHPEWNQLVHVLITDSWVGEPQESEEMLPKWYKVENLPYDTMWPDDLIWLPEVLTGKKIKGSFTLGKDSTILESEIHRVQAF